MSKKVSKDKTIFFSNKNLNFFFISVQEFVFCFFDKDINIFVYREGWTIREISFLFVFAYLAWIC
jgi:hypothetical protein